MGVVKTTLVKANFRVHHTLGILDNKNIRNGKNLFGSINKPE